jgi:hypothetical protein
MNTDKVLMNTANLLIKANLKIVELKKEKKKIIFIIYRLIAESGDSKSKKFLFERISLAIQRGNAASIRGTFPDSALLSKFSHCKLKMLFYVKF